MALFVLCVAALTLGLQAQTTNGLVSRCSVSSGGNGLQAGELCGCGGGIAGCDWRGGCGLRSALLVGGVHVEAGCGEDGGA